MASKGEGTYTCDLPPDVIDKARKELNEDPDKRKQDIQDFRNMIISHPGMEVDLTIAHASTWEFQVRARDLKIEQGRPTGPTRAGICK